jgi:hypothetical protein
MVTTWDASFVMAGVRTIGPKRAQRDSLLQRWAQPFPRTGGVPYAIRKVRTRLVVVNVGGSMPRLAASERIHKLSRGFTDHRTLGGDASE